MSDNREQQLAEARRKLLEKRLKSKRQESTPQAVISKRSDDTPDVSLYWATTTLVCAAITP